jgi:hypothetical protein
LTKPPVIGPPLRFVLTFVTLTQLYVYVAVVLYSLIYGSIDYVLPIKSAFLVTIVVGIILAIEEVRIGWRKHREDLSPVGLGIIRSLIEVAPLILGVWFGSSFLFRNFSNVDLRDLTLELRIMVAIGIGVMVLFSFVILFDLVGLLRRKEIPRMGGVA